MYMYIYVPTHRDTYIYIYMYIYMGVSILFALQKGGAAIDRVLFKNAYSKLDNREVPQRPLL